MVLNNVSGSCTTRLDFISLSTMRRNSSGSIPASIASTGTLPCFSVYCRPPSFTTSVSPLPARYFRRERFGMNTMLSTGTFALIFSTRKIWWQSSTSLVYCTSTPAIFRALSLAPAWRDKSRLAIIECVSNHHSRHRNYQLPPRREHPFSSIFMDDIYICFCCSYSK